MRMLYLSDRSDYSSSYIDAKFDDSNMEFENLLLRCGYTHPNQNKSKTTQNTLLSVLVKQNMQEIWMQA